MSVLASIRGAAAGSGGGFGPFYPAEQALVAESSTARDRNPVFASLSSVGVLTAAAGSLLAGLPHILQTPLQLSTINSYRPVFWITALSSLMTILLVLPVREEPRTSTKRSAAVTTTALPPRQLIGRLWLTNGLNGFVIGVVGPFLTYWLAVRCDVGTGEIAILYTAANLLTAVSYSTAPAIARRLGAVRTIVVTALRGCPAHGGHGTLANLSLGFVGICWESHGELNWDAGSAVAYHGN